jgi:anti-sigma B factor antagonist
MIVTAGGPDHPGVTVAGEVDASNADRLRLALLDAAGQHDGRIEVDLAGITFMDSTGLRAIAEASAELGPDGSRFLLCNVPRQVLRILQITDIAGALEVRR